MAADFFAGAFLTAGFLAEVFFVAGFFAGDFFEAVFAAGLADFAAGFLVDFVNLTPAALAILEAADLRREAVFFSMRSFLTALSYSD